MTGDFGANSVGRELMALVLALNRDTLWVLCVSLGCSVCCSVCCSGLHWALYCVLYCVLHCVLHCVAVYVANVCSV